MAHILIVDDERSIRDVIKMTLQLENYTFQEAVDGQEALDFIEKEHFDLILLDIMLPVKDGYQVLQEMKCKHIDVPILFLTAKVSVQDRVMGLKLGAEDYVVKPFEPIELLARIEVILRRKPKGEIGDSLIYKDIEVQQQERLVKKNGYLVDLTAKEFDLLVYFLQHQNIALSRDLLLEDVWDFDYMGGTRTVDVHVRQLRDKLDLSQELQTVYKVGYKLVKL
ncbi:response regulator transcription factor [Streptococcus equinus]|uniref:response regulator transcription factor n=1 Tax=Streptococcus equinus TaxID=1335 RepID=UPI00088E2707|nr:response regulator transcription factor [Streptococcus equinus]SDJ11511.1 DNA-binding response regulator, OmpR family, contains REC and winged-helix (wHTH) domain [Streptococcus equinus]SEQ02815.1 DNA-binding response regulator, OmpR family, contains REC and winged-helix (wHTH) domain [Streptococcus equinus]